MDREAVMAQETVTSALWEAMELTLEAEQRSKTDPEDLEDHLAMIRQALDRALDRLGMPYPG